MALTLSIPSPFTGGLAATYWRITGATYDADAQTLDIVVSGYVSQADRDAGRPALLVRRSRAVGIASASVGMATAYTELKDTPEFAGALDA